MTDQVITDSPTQTVEEQASAVTPNIQSDNQAGSIDHAGSGEVVEQTQEVATPSPTEEVNAIGDLNEYEAMKSRLQQDPNALATPITEEAAEVVTEEAVAPVDTTSAAALEAAAQETETEVAKEEELPTKKEPQFRLRPQEDLDAEAFRIFTAANHAQAPVSMTAALTIARSQLGIPEPSAQTQQPVATDTEAATAEEAAEDSVFDGITQESAKANLKELRMGQNRAMRDGDLDEAADLGEQIIDAEDLIEVLGEREADAAEVARSETRSNFDNSYTKAVDTFPDFAKEDTPFFAKCKEIDEALETTNDPRYYDANKPLLVAQMAARALDVVPTIAGKAPVAAPAAAVQPASTPPQQTTSPQPARTEKPATLPSASGASRTGGITGASKDLQTQIAEITNPEDFAKMAKAMGQTG